MNPIEQAVTGLDDIKIHVKLKLSALWSSVMFCYIYADYFGLYVPGSMQQLLAGKMGPLGPVTQMVLLGTSATLAIPSVMIFLSLVLSGFAKYTPTDFDMNVHFRWTTDSGYGGTKKKQDTVSNMSYRQILVTA